MKGSKVYIIEYRFYDKVTETWISHTSQEGYSSYEDARKFCEQKLTNRGVTVTPMYFQNDNNGLSEEYYIHEVIIK